MYADRPLESVLDALGRAEPAPGGGSAAAWGCALGAALVQMAAGFTTAPGRFPDVHERMRSVEARAAALRALALDLAERDPVAYASAMAARRLPDSDPERPGAIERAERDAVGVPLATAEAATEVAALGAEVVRSGNANLRGDVVTGTLLAEAACAAAARLVEINLPDAPSDARIARARELARQAATARAAAQR